MNITLHIPDEAAERLPVIALAKFAAEHGCQLESRWHHDGMRLVMVPRWKSPGTEAAHIGRRRAHEAVSPSEILGAELCRVDGA